MFKGNKRIFNYKPYIALKLLLIDNKTAYHLAKIPKEDKSKQHLV